MTMRAVWTGFFALIAAFSAPFLSDSFAVPPDKIRVGVILPFSGDAAGIGEAMRNGFEMGLGTLPEGVRSKLEITYEDDGLVTKNAVSAYYKLRSSGKADILINASSGTGLALAPLTEKDEVPFISISSDPQVSKDRNFVFNFWVSPEAEADAAIAEAVRRGYKKIARITTLHNGTIAVSDGVDKRNNGRLQIVLDERYQIDNKDFKTYLAKLRSAKDIDAVMVILLPGQCGVFARQVVEAGFKQELFGFEVFEDSTQVELSAGALIGKWYVNADDPDNTFVDSYRAKHPKSSLYGASNAYDSALLIGAAVQNGTDAKGFAGYLASLKDFKGALGTYSASGDHRFTLPAAIKVVTKSGFEKVR